MEERSAIYLYTKFQADRCISSKVIWGVPKFWNSVTWPRPRPLMAFYDLHAGVVRTLSLPNLKRIVQFVQKLQRGTKILKLGHVT